MKTLNLFRLVIIQANSAENKKIPKTNSSKLANMVYYIYTKYNI